MLGGILRSLTAIAALTVLAPEFAAADASIEEVRARYAECRAAASANSEQTVTVFAVYRDEDFTRPPVWVRRAGKDAMVVSELKAISMAGHIRSATLFRTSPSGDWSQTLVYCFRAGGSLAFLRVELRTFMGNVRVVDRLYFSPDGAEIRRLRSFFDLSSGKAITGRPPAFQDMDVLVFPNRAALVRHASPALE